MAGTLTGKRVRRWWLRPIRTAEENFESTEWSIVFSLDSEEVRYYHRENYENSYTFHVNE